MNDSQFSESMMLNMSQNMSSKSYIGGSVVDQLNYVKKQQKEMLNTLKLENPSGCLSMLKKTFHSLQEVLTSVNKTLSNEKKIIKEEHSSQIERNESTGDDTKMVKAAKRIVQQQKTLVASLKVHKQLGSRIKSLEQKSHSANHTSVGSTICGGVTAPVSNATTPANDDTQQTQMLIKSLLGGFSQMKARDVKQATTQNGVPYNSKTTFDIDVHNNAITIPSSNYLNTPKNELEIKFDEQDSPPPLLVSTSLNLSLISPPRKKSMCNDAVVPTSPLYPNDSLNLNNFSLLNNSMPKSSPKQTKSDTSAAVVPASPLSYQIPIVLTSTPTKQIQDTFLPNSSLVHESITQKQNVHTNAASNDLPKSSDNTPVAQVTTQNKSMEIGTDHNLMESRISSSFPIDPAQCSEVTDVNKLYTLLISDGIIQPGKDVLMIKISGDYLFASIEDNHKIRWNNCQFLSLEAWLCHVSKMEKVDAGVLRKVAYMGTPLYSLIGGDKSRSQIVPVKRTSKDIKPEFTEAGPASKKIYQIDLTDNNSSISRIPSSNNVQPTQNVQGFPESQSILASQKVLATENIQVSESKSNATGSFSTFSQLSPKTILTYAANEFVDMRAILPSTFWDDAGFASVKLDDTFLQKIGFDD